MTVDSSATTGWDERSAWLIVDELKWGSDNVLDIRVLNSASGNISGGNVIRHHSTIFFSLARERAGAGAGFKRLTEEVKPVDQV